MRKNLLTLLLLLSALAGAARADWIFSAATYSHDPTSGERVNQYTQAAPSYAQWDGTYQQSGFRHHHTVIWGADGSADHLNVVETWGQGQSIRPYGEWERPYRPGATPYTSYGSFGSPYAMQGMMPMPYVGPQMMGPPLGPMPYYPTTPVYRPAAPMMPGP